MAESDEDGCPSASDMAVRLDTPLDNITRLTWNHNKPIVNEEAANLRPNGDESDSPSQKTEPVYEDMMAKQGPTSFEYPDPDDNENIDEMFGNILPPTEQEIEVEIMSQRARARMAVDMSPNTTPSSKRRRRAPAKSNVMQSSAEMETWETLTGSGNITSEEANATPSTNALKLDGPLDQTPPAKQTISKSKGKTRQRSNRRGMSRRGKRAAVSDASVTKRGVSSRRAANASPTVARGAVARATRQVIAQKTRLANSAVAHLTAVVETYITTVVAQASTVAGGDKGGVVQLEDVLQAVEDNIDLNLLFHQIFNRRVRQPQQTQKCSRASTCKKPCDPSNCSQNANM